MNTMKIQLMSEEDELISMLKENLTLEQLGIKNGMKLVVDGEEPGGEDVDEDVNFKLPEEEYEKRDDTARQFLQRNKLGKYDELKKSKLEEELRREDEIALQIPIDSRCEVTLKGQLPKRGRVMFNGKVHFKPGTWIGVEYDEPVGKNNGSVDGTEYFVCKDKYGAFLRPSNVNSGDYPVIDELELELDEI